jgi:hypothetical protein
MATTVTDLPELASAARRPPPTRGVTHRRFAGLLAACSLLPSVATAQLKCQTRQLPAPDVEALHAVAAAALTGRLPLDPESGRYCRNPGYAYAWFDSTAERDADGTKRWYAMQCHRRKVAWTCQEPTLERELELTTDVLGMPRRVMLRLDANVDASRARLLAPRAIWLLLGKGDSHPPACNPGRDNNSTWTDARQRSDLDAEQDPLSLEVSADSRGTRFGWLLGIVFRPSAPGSDEFAPCWDELIVVTAERRQ